MKFASEKSRRGYTLLELLLSLALTVIVMSVIAGSVRLYLLQLDRQQKSIERRMVARSVLSMIRGDLRAAIQYKANDYSGLENLQQTIASIQGATPSPEDIETMEDDAEMPIMQDEEAASFRPSLIGTAKALRIDISRLPRLDQYNPLVVRPSDAPLTGSDVKSVSWFVSFLNPPSLTSASSVATVAGGLIRDSVDRAVASYRGDTGLLLGPDLSSDVIAPEIVELQFRYFDGTSWFSEWDSEEQAGFPSAVEVTVVLDPARVSTTPGEYAYGGFNPQTMELSRLVVQLPLAEIIESEDE